MMTFWQAIFLSIVQGITEFLPISSSGHLIILPKVFGWRDQGLAFDAIVHLGTTLAAIVYFLPDVKTILHGFIKKSETKARKMIVVILLSMIPALITGILLQPLIETQARSVLVVAINLVFWGIVLILAERYSQKKQGQTSFYDINWKQGLIVGVAQALALIPGTSRSGITISTALFLRIKKEDAVKFSFLMGVPVILGAGIFSFVDLLQQPGQAVQLPLVLVSLVGSFLSGLLAIYLLISFLEKRGLYYLGAYRIVLASILFFSFF